MKYGILPIIALMLICTKDKKMNQITARIITVENCESPVKLIIGDTLIVKLKGSPGTGYSWYNEGLSESNNIIKFIDSKTLSSSADKEGGMTYMIFEFLLLQRSDILLHFEYKRPWEKTKPPLYTCDLKLQIRNRD
jgi:predicted secreted protein